MVFKSKCYGFAFGCAGVTKFAAKTFNPENSTREAWIREVTMMNNIRHKNILPLYCVTKNYFVMKYMCFGTLHNYLEKYETQLSLETRHFISSEVADGMQYLHSKNIIHGDFHVGNILVGKKNNKIEIRISDFGDSKVLQSPAEKNSRVKFEVNCFLNILLVVYAKHSLLLKNLLKAHYIEDPLGLRFIVKKKWIPEINKIEHKIAKTTFIEMNF